MINSPIGQRSKIPVQRTLAKLGFELVSTTTGRRAHLMASVSRLGIATTVDIGANVGQFGQSLRSLGFQGRILSVEPLPEAFAALESAARRDPLWTTRKFAVGRSSGSEIMNVSKNLTSSSLLTVNDLHRIAEPTTAIVGLEQVEVRTLDELVSAENLDGPLFVKIDVQGLELDVIAGARSVLERSALVRVELSFQELYAGSSDYLEVLGALREHGFAPIGIETALEDPRTGDVLQVDVLAARA
ncbi:MAG: FkbM family methyltransferase [Sporichthyaceae bacterium]